MTINIERLAVDAEYWGAVAPEGATHYDTSDSDDPWTAKTPEGWCFYWSSKDQWVGYHQKTLPRDAIDRLISRPTATEWNGKGLPPVGCECEIGTEYGHLPCRIVSHGEDYVVAHIHPNEHNLKVDWTRHGCRPTRTPEQRQRDELKALVRAAYIDGASTHVGALMRPLTPSFPATPWSRSHEPPQ